MSFDTGRDILDTIEHAEEICTEFSLDKHLDDTFKVEGKDMKAREFYEARAREAVAYMEAYDKAEDESPSNVTQAVHEIREIEILARGLFRFHPLQKYIAEHKPVTVPRIGDSERLNATTAFAVRVINLNSKVGQK